MSINHAVAVLLQNQRPYQQRVKGYDWEGCFSIDGMVIAPATQNYYLSLFTPNAIEIDWIAYIQGTGMGTIAVQQGPNIAGLANVTGMSALSVTGTLTITDNTATDGTNYVPIGSVIAIAFSGGAGGPANLAFSLGYHRR